MRIIPAVLICCVVLCAASCSQVMVSYDYDKNANFTAFKTYGWHAIERTVEMNDLVINRVKDAVNRELEARGFRQVPENPDFFIALHVSSRQKVELIDWGNAPGPYWGGWGGNYGGVDSIEYQEGTLMIDIVDAAKNELVWRGSATGIVDPGLSPEKRTQEINNAVARILEKFPPTP